MTYRPFHLPFLGNHYIRAKDGNPRNLEISNLEIRPMLPTRTKAEYDAERDPVNVLSSVARRVQIGPHVLNVVAEDFPSIKDCETAASRLQEILKAERNGFPGMTVTETLDAIADRLRLELNVDSDPEHPRPFGCCFTGELI